MIQKMLYFSDLNFSGRPNKPYRISISYAFPGFKHD